MPINAPPSAKASSLPHKHTKFITPAAYVDRVSITYTTKPIDSFLDLFAEFLCFARHRLCCKGLFCHAGGVGWRGGEAWLLVVGCWLLGFGFRYFGTKPSMYLRDVFGR